MIIEEPDPMSKSQAKRPAAQRKESIGCDGCGDVHEGACNPAVTIPHLRGEVERLAGELKAIYAHAITCPVCGNAAVSLDWKAHKHDHPDVEVAVYSCMNGCEGEPGEPFQWKDHGSGVTLDMLTRAEAAEKRAKELEKCDRDAKMYARAWERELRGYIRQKTHHIDAMVVSTRKIITDLEAAERRVGVLEGALSDRDNVCRKAEVDAVKLQNRLRLESIEVDKLRLALTWYASERNYKGANQAVRFKCDEDRGGGYRLDVSIDRGKKARAALNGGGGP